MALLPTLLGAGPGDLVLHPQAAYPTYDVGARLAGATPVPVDTDADPATWVLPGTSVGQVAMVWLNSPGNPDGHVLAAEQMARIVAWARQRGAVVVSDECYAEPGLGRSLGEPGRAQPPRPARGRRQASRRTAPGCWPCTPCPSSRTSPATGPPSWPATPSLVGVATEVRKHAGLMVPAPVQAAMVAALGDEEHVATQRETYRRRREVLLEAVRRVGLVDDPATGAGLYLWLEGPASMSAMDLVGAFAEPRHRGGAGRLLWRGRRRACAHEPHRHR